MQAVFETLEVPTAFLAPYYFAPRYFSRSKLEVVAV